MKSFRFWLMFGGVFCLAAASLVDDVLRLAVDWEKMATDRHGLFYTPATSIGFIIGIDIWLMMGMSIAGACMILNDLRIKDK